MARTRTTPTAKLTPKYGTSSGTNPAEDFEEPEDLSDVAGIDAEIPRGSARPTGSLIQPKPKPRSPIGVEVGKSAGGGLGITVALPLGGGPISGRGGINIGKGGAIKGGSIGLGFGLGPIGGSIDMGTDQDEEGRGGCYQYVTITVGPFSHTYGRNVCEPKPPKESPLPTPPPPVPPPGTFDPGNMSVVNSGLPDSDDLAWVVTTEIQHSYRWYPTSIDWWNVGKTKRTVVDRTEIPEGLTSIPRRAPFNINLQYEDNFGGYAEKITPTRLSSIFTYVVPGNFNQIVVCQTSINSFNSQIAAYCGKLRDIKNYLHTFQQFRIDRLKALPGSGATFISDYIPQVYVVEVILLKKVEITAPLSPPVPNPPPRKKMDDKCCKALMLMMLMQHKHLGVTPVPGMEQLDALAGVKAKGEKFQTEQMAFPFEVPKVWLDPTAKPQDRLPVRNVSELLFIMASQSERLEHVLGTKEFLKDRDGQLRGSEIGTIKWLTQRVTGISGNDFTYPDPNDFWFNTDDGIINEKKVEVRSVADAIRYLVESQNRLERILPVAEIKNSTIPARWVYPGKKGQLRVGNLIHLVEYMFRADDRARGFWPQTVKIKDANPAIKGDQKIELKFESQADMLREILKFLIDTEGDGDISNNFALRSAIQNCQQHQLLVQNNAMLDAIVEYMDFKIERTKTKVPMPFSPFAGHQPNLFDQLLTKLGFGNKQIPGSIDKNTEEAVEALFEGVLQNTEVEVPIIKANEKKSMSEAFMEILKHASAASAAVSERVGEGALKRLVDSAGIAQAVSRFLLKRDIAESSGVGDLDQWINSAEAGYTDKPESQSLRFPESNPLEPYDRPIAENPRIREIDTKDSKAD